MATPKVEDHPAASPGLLASKTCSHRQGDGTYDFEWQFNGPEFEIRGKSIPPDLVFAFTGSDKPVQKIRGRWALKGRNILFTELTIDGVPIPNSHVQMIAYSAGTVRIKSPAAVYTF